MNVISFSSGLSSAIAADRVLVRYGRSATKIVFMNTLIEDDDNYRFLDECRRRWQMPITVLTEGRTPYEIGTDQHIIPNQKVAPCTFRLKIELFRDLLEKLDRNLTVHIGYDYSEVHRCEATRTAYNALGYGVDFPLLWKPYETRPYTFVVKEDWGIDPPRMYGMGYTHANCGGMCVKQGQGDWLRTLINFPDRYRRVENWEREMRERFKMSYALLRDSRNGEVKPLTLEDFRERHQRERDIQPLLFDLDSGQSGCVYCGVGDFINS